MKRDIRFAICTTMFLLLPMRVLAADFLGAPLLEGAEILKRTPARVEMKSDLSHDEIVRFYREALKELPDIKFREWKESTHIEDDGRLKWHSITISRGDKDTLIVIVKDNWTWIIGTLILRFVGVFAVLLVLYLGMTVSGQIISRSVKHASAKKA